MAIVVAFIGMALVITAASCWNGRPDYCAIGALDTPAP